MPDFVLCEHPELPGQRARFAFPRNGWTPVDEDIEQLLTEATGLIDHDLVGHDLTDGVLETTTDPSTSSDGEQLDDPTAGQSDPLKENENNG